MAEPNISDITILIRNRCKLNYVIVSAEYGSETWTIPKALDRLQQCRLFTEGPEAVTRGQVAGHGKECDHL